MKNRSYHELIRLETFEERFDYLKVFGEVGRATFGFDRWLNQQFYTSSEWRHVRYEVIARDEGRDLGVKGYEISDRVIIHHMNPMTVYDVEQGNADILDPEFLITISHNTHNAVHYGDKRLLKKPFVVRRAGDTKLW